jgi:hypothetical protein
MERTQARLRRAETDLADARSRLLELIELHRQAPPIASPEPTLSRQQRRAMERNERKRKR